MIDDYVIKDSDNVVVTEMNHIVEVQYMQKKNSKVNIKKLNKDKYLDIRTGEIKEFKKIDNRSESTNSLRQTFKKIRYLINNNFSGCRNELHVVLTYREHMTDTERLYNDFRKFMQRLRYQYRNVSRIEYISVIEPMQDGRWHCHVLMRFDDVEKIFISNKFINNKPVNAPLYDLWKNGWVTIKSLKDVDNIGAYLSAYLTDIELTDENIDILRPGMKVKMVDDKKFIKGGRLHFYPAGMNIYRNSKGIKLPERKKMKFRDIKNIVKDSAPHYTKTYNVQTDDFENVITYYQYNLKRK